jgi:hypothetical protein
MSDGDRFGAASILPMPARTPICRPMDRTHGGASTSQACTAKRPCKPANDTFKSGWSDYHT